MKLAIKQAAWVFRHYMENTHGTDGQGNYHSCHVVLATTFDDGLDFVYAFGEEFPGRKPDSNHHLAAIRAWRLMNQLWKDGWLDRWVLGNDDCSLPGTPRWQHCYVLPQLLINKLKRGIETPETLAEQWGG